jgi:hypothetical protein
MKYIRSQTTLQRGSKVRAKFGAVHVGMQVAEQNDYVRKQKQKG